MQLCTCCSINGAMRNEDAKARCYIQLMMLSIERNQCAQPLVAYPTYIIKSDALHKRVPIFVFMLR
ncbi:hypothetical protein T02_2154 [Trichinella nativa]|uniref:Uncharacterized protein n=1 Tax=Trichinella nativa TaxID=6335 RepID=A0A0V1KMX2_9BILA|nr:hypothetical protein T02_2154 [Trichinella nativa]KRZ48334.1 hypothetical protein T02_2154 [Trichinella nativa]